jgi:DNA (cytosine-5)-methyltransferase 1
MSDERWLMIFWMEWSKVKFFSVCSGIDAFSVAWNPLGMQAVAFTEIEKFPCAVLAHHFPDVPNLGDITKLTERDLERFAGTTDIVCGGTPCQSFSVAGLRGGLDDARGNLALRFCQLVGAMRPRWFVWENVPGVLSSGGGRDFGALLGAMAQLGYGFAYRILDAQYVRVQSHAFAVPQVRRRVFVVGHLGDWRRAAAVLFERESLCGNPPPRREAGERVAGTIANRASGGGGFGTDFEIDGGLVATHTHTADTAGRMVSSGTRRQRAGQQHEDGAPDSYFRGCL